MKNYKDSDYALNKFSEGIVYRFADRIVQITMEDYLAENPGKTEQDFIELKALSDEIYHQQVTHENRTIKTKRECKWSQNAISRILTNEIYTGKIINGKQEVADFLTGVRKEKDESEWYVIDRPELRIIEDETFVKAAKLLEQRNNSFNINHERQSNKHLYSTLIKCACCGYSFRRTERCYKNTYIKWVCSGRNANGKDSCNNMTKIDEEELTQALQEYFTEILSTRQDAVKNIVAEFNRIYHSKDDNSEYEQELTERLTKATKSRKKNMDMYEDELITREELREKVGALNIEIEKCENELKLVKYNLSKGDQLEQVLHNTFKDWVTETASS